MAKHELLGHAMTIEGFPVRIGFLRRECGHGVASHMGYNSDKSPAFLIRLSDCSVVRRLKPSEQNFDEAIQNAGKLSAV